MPLERGRPPAAGRRRLLLGGLVVALAGLGAWGCAPDPAPARLIDADVADGLDAAQEALEAQHYGRVLVLTDTLIARVPDLAEPYYLRGQALTELSRLGAAAEAFLRVRELEPDRASVRFKQGNLAFLRGKYEAAVRHYHEERRLLGPAGVRAAQVAVWLQLGRAHQLLGRGDSARSAYQRVLALDSTQAQAYGWLSELTSDEGRLEEALRLARRALDLDPTQADYLYRSGQLLNQLGHSEEALPLLAHAFRAQPWNQGASYNLGLALERLGRRDEGARYLALADTLQRLQADIAKAQAGAYQQPRNVNRWLELANLTLSTGQYAEAHQALQAALALAPGNLSIQSDLANLALARGDTAQALRRFQALVRQDSTFADGWFNLGVVHAFSGDEAAARRAWRAALRHAPQHPEAAAALASLAP